MTVKNKRAAMEMSVGTIVTIVLLMIVLVLGVFFIQKIFATGTSAIDSIDAQVQSQLQKLFAEDNKNIAVYPTSREISLKQGDTKGFAFSVRNSYNNDTTFTYKIESDPAFDFASKCGSGFTKTIADDWLVKSSGTFILGRGQSLELPELILFEIPKDAPLCTIPYTINVEKNDGSQYVGTSIYVTIK